MNKCELNEHKIVSTIISQLSPASDGLLLQCCREEVWSRDNQSSLIMLSGGGGTACPGSSCTASTQSASSPPASSPSTSSRISSNSSVCCRLATVRSNSSTDHCHCNATPQEASSWCSTSWWSSSCWSRDTSCRAWRCGPYPPYPASCPGGTR